MAVQTQILHRRGTAATWTSTNPTLGAGEVGFETDTGKFKLGDGTTAWASLPYAAIDAALLNAKGDLVTATANDTPARLAVGNNGETLVADSSATTGLRWQGNFAAGKNVIINGDFRLNQRNFTSITTSGVYGFDRWISSYNDGTNTMTPQTFTAGTAPVAGYEAINYVRLQSSGQTAATSLSAVTQRVEDVRTFAGQTITVSFWAKASTGTPNIVVWAQQYFGSGGSTSVNNGATSGKKAISTSWSRYSFVIPLASISGKTIGSGSYLSIVLTQSAGTDRDSYTDSLGIQSVTIDYWGVQAEAGNVATAFQTATGTIQGELAACQRYYWRTPTASSAYSLIGQTMGAYSTTVAEGYVQFPVPMRVWPTSADASTLRLQDNVAVGAAVTAVTLGNGTPIGGKVAYSVASGLTQYRVYYVETNNSTAGYLGFSAEL